MLTTYSECARVVLSQEEKPMSSYVRNENASKPVKETAISKSLNILLGSTLKQVPHAHEKLADKLEEIAERELGIFDESEMTVTFGTTEESVIVYASLDEEDNPVYQALHRRSNPTFFVASFPQSDFNLALESLARKVSKKEEEA